MAEITPEMIAKLIAEGIAQAMAAKKEAWVDNKKKMAPEEQVKADAKVAKAFVKKGYKDIVLFDRTKPLAAQPECTILTFNKWMQLGRRPKEGEHALAFGRFRFFHKTQTRIATIEERKANHAKMQEAIKRHEEKTAGKSAATA